MAIKICPLDNLQIGGNLKVTINGIAIAFFRTPSGEVKAINDKCSHGEVSLTDKDWYFSDLLTDKSIECHAHGAKFSLEDGKPLGFPATDGLDVYPVIIENDMIYLDYDPEQ
jgi:3-phenylpropionate/trans-cinnamate dioxygenase ferredoxin subunit